MTKEIPIGINARGASKGADEVVKALRDIQRTANRMSGDSGQKIEELFQRISKLSKVAVASQEKIKQIAQLGKAIDGLSRLRGVNPSVSQSVTDLLSAISKSRAPSKNMTTSIKALFAAINSYKSRNFSNLVSLMNAMNNFRGPNGRAVSNAEKLFTVLSNIPTGKNLATMASNANTLSNALNKVNAASNSANSGFSRAGAGANQAGAKFSRFRTEALSLSSVLLRTAEVLPALGAVAGISGIAKQIDSFQKSNAALQGVTGSATIAATEFSYLQQVADDLSVYIGDLTNGYAQFRAASAETTLTVEQTQKAFRDITQGARVFGLSADDTAGVYRALTQIMAKGQLQMEELRGQLGDRLPIAMRAAADAMGVTTEALFEMVKNKEITGKKLDEFVVGFAASIAAMTDRGLASSLETISAGIARVQNAFFEFSQAVGQAGLTSALNDIFNGVVVLLKEGGALNTIARALAGGFAFLTRNADILAISLATVATAMAASAIYAQVTMISAYTTKVTAAIIAVQAFAASLAVSSAAAGTTAVATAGAAASTGLLTGVLVAARVAMNMLTAAMMANPFLFIAGGVIALGTAIALFVKETNGATKAQKALQSSGADLQNSLVGVQDEVRKLTTDYQNMSQAARDALRASTLADIQGSTRKAGQNFALAKQNTELPLLDRLRGRGGSDQAKTLKSLGVQISGAQTERDIKNLVVQVDALAKDNRSSKQVVEAATATSNALKAGLNELDKARLSSQKFTAAVAPNSKAGKDARMVLFGDTTGAGAGSGGAGGADGGKGKSRVLPKLESTLEDLINKTAEIVKVRATLEAYGKQGVFGSTEVIRRIEIEADATQMAKTAWQEYSQTLAEGNRSTFEKAISSGNKTAEGLKATAIAAAEAKDKLASLNNVASQMRGLSDTYSRLIDVEEATRDLLKISDQDFNKLFPNSVINRTEAIRRSIDKVFDAQSALDFGQQATAAVEEATASMELYLKTLKDRGFLEDKLEKTLRARAKLEMLANGGEAAGAYGAIAKSLLDYQKNLATLSATNAAVDSDTVNLTQNIYDLALAYTQSARSAMEATTAGKFLSKTYEEAINNASNLGSTLDAAFGGSNFSNQVKMLQAQTNAAREFAAGQSAMRNTKIGAGGALGPSESDIEKIVVQGARKAGDALSKEGQIYVNAAIDAEKLRQDLDRKTQDFQLRLTLIPGADQAPLLNSLKILQAGAGATLAAQQQTILRESIQRTQDAIARAQLEATNVGKVLSDGIDRAGDAFENFIKTGTLDLEALLRDTVASFARTTFIDPMLTKVRSAFSGGKDPTADIQKAADATGVQIAFNQALNNATVAEAQIIARTEAVTLRLEAITSRDELTATTMSNAATMFQAAVAAMPHAGAVNSGAALPQVGTQATQVASPASPIGPTSGVAVPQSTGAGGAVNAIAAPLQNAAKTLTQGSSVLSLGADTFQQGALSLIGSVIPGFNGSIAQQILSAVFGQIAAGTTATAAGATAAAAATNVTAGAALLASAAALTTAALSLTAAAVANAIPFFHSGGIIGKDGDMRRRAPRGNEQLLIGQKGEEVLTPDHPRHRDNYQPSYVAQPVYSPSSSSSSTGNVNVVNYNSFTMTGDSSGSVSPEEQARIGKVISDSVEAAIAKKLASRERSLSQRGGRK